MKRTTSLALAAMLALVLAAAISGSASAATFNASFYPAKVSGKPTGGTHEFSFFSGGLQFSCTGPTLEDKIELREPNSRRSRSGSGSDIGCQVGSSSLNGCDLIFRPGNESEGVFKGTVDIGPAGCGPVKLSYPNCNIEIPVQTGLSATYDNVNVEGLDRVSASLNTSGMKYTSSGPGCSNGTFTNGGWDGEWLLSAKEGKGSSVGLYLESASGSPLLQLEAESYAAKLSGEQLAGDPLVWSFPISEGGGAAKISCKATTFGGEISGGAATIGLTPAYSECMYGESPNTTVKLNSCSYKAALNAGTLQVSCSKEGDMIEMTSYINATPVCIAKVGAQTVSGLASETRAAGTSRYVESDWNLTGIKYTLVKNSFFCPYTSGTYSNGTYTGGSRLDGKTSGGTAQRIEIRD